MEAPTRKDDYVRDYQYCSYHAIQPDLRSRIELQVQDTSKYFLPYEAFIEIEGELATNVAAGTPYADDANVRVGFVNNGIMALFESARYLIDEKEIESIEREVDVATIIGLAKYSDDYTRSAGPFMMFAKDTSDNNEHIQFSRVKAIRDTAVDSAPAGYTRPAAAFDVINTVPSFNLGFATRVTTLQGHARQFLCAIR